MPPHAPCKIKLVGTEITGFRSPAAKAPAKTSDLALTGVVFKQNTLRRKVPNRALPTAAVLARMPDSHKGSECCNGKKEWGDGNGSEVFKDGITYVCHACLVELPMPGWAALSFNNQAEADAFAELNFD